jgi:hypothetical protein
MRDDLLFRHETVRIVFGIAHAGKAGLPARRVEREGIPSMIAPGIAWLACLFQDQVILGSSS